MPIPLSTPDDPQEVWGLATWEDIDPRIDFFSIFVNGLTNAYKPVDLPDVYQAGEKPGTGREILSKTLRLNFWRPGDTIDEYEDHIYYGVPYSPDAARQYEILTAFGLRQRLDYSVGLSLKVRVSLWDNQDFIDEDPPQWPIRKVKARAETAGIRTRSGSA